MSVESTPGPSDHTLYIGLDVGGTHIKSGVGTDDGTLVWTGEIPTRADEGKDAVLAAFLAAATAARDQALAAGGEFLMVGIGVPGQIDAASGRQAFEVANLPDFQGVDLPGLLRDELGLAAAIDNDANVALRGEARWGAGRGHRDILMVTVGTGIGGALLVNGAIVRGWRGGGGEIGHIPRVEGGRRCGCGQSGCLEAHAGGRGMLAAWKERQAPSGSDDLQVRDLQVRDLLDAAAAGDSTAREVLDEGAAHLARGIETVLQLVNPEVVILGGGILEGVPGHAATVEARLRANADPRVTEGMEVKRARFGNRAGIMGGISLAMELDRKGGV